MVGVAIVGKSKWVKMKGRYKCTIITLCIGFLCALFAFSLLIMVENSTILAVSGSLLGLFLFPSMTIGVELACEIGFPVGESYSNGLI